MSRLDTDNTKVVVQETPLKNSAIVDMGFLEYVEAPQGRLHQLWGYLERAMTYPHQVNSLYSPFKDIETDTFAAQEQLRKETGASSVGVHGEISLGDGWLHAPVRFLKSDFDDIAKLLPEHKRGFFLIHSGIGMFSLAVTATKKPVKTKPSKFDPTVLEQRTVVREPRPKTVEEQQAPSPTDSTESVFSKWLEEVSERVLSLPEDLKDRLGISCVQEVEVPEERLKEFDRKKTQNFLIYHTDDKYQWVHVPYGFLDDFKDLAEIFRGHKNFFLLRGANGEYRAAVPRVTEIPCEVEAKPTTDPKPQETTQPYQYKVVVAGSGFHPQTLCADQISVEGSITRTSKFNAQFDEGVGPDPIKKDSSETQVNRFLIEGSTEPDEDFIWDTKCEMYKVPHNRFVKEKGSIISIRVVNCETETSLYRLIADQVTVTRETSGTRYTKWSIRGSITLDHTKELDPFGKVLA